MSGPNAPYTALDANQVIKNVYDETNDRLRTDATLTVGSATIEVSTSHVDDSIRLGDGTNLTTATVVGPKVGLDVNIINSAGLATETTLSAINTKIPSGLTVTSNRLLVDAVFTATNLDIRDLTFARDKVDVSGSTVSVDNFPSVQDVSATDLDIRNLTFVSDKVDVTGSTVSVDNFPLVQDVNITNITLPLPTGAATEATLSDIDTKIVTTIDGIKVDAQLEAFTGSTPDNVQLVGSIDGTKTGTKFGFVNNLRQQVLDSHDRNAIFTYADFGTKDQRITRIDYTSTTFSGNTIRRDFSYTLVGTKYRRDNEIWTII